MIAIETFIWHCSMGYHRSKIFTSGIGTKLEPIPVMAPEFKISVHRLHSEQVGTHTEQTETHSEQVGMHNEQVGMHNEQVRTHNEQVGGSATGTQLHLQKW